MPTLYTRSFDRVCDSELFLPIEEVPSQFEQHVRFLYAVHSLLRTIRKSYHVSELKTPTAMYAGERRDIDVWYPRKGTPALLTTEVACRPLERPWVREFEQDPLYGGLKKALLNPVREVRVTLESAAGEMMGEFNRLCQVYDGGCNDPNWKTQLPRFILSPPV